ncbi:4-hydroxythreonine-4-phosphate dehydrogenase PdxA [Marinoscillum furvescens]|uniref:4-hydroxythreonine-4-phosphate dehydrogenase n=1 Tax=Marinoscillum furvescens DSM 4134 TaxID=1122208 RepID=A0A3D9L530_MARFU|nr:4-hydroxythreonine-4-phosphate dehydrogenase PdxA [Marinoscillum furvescens]REE01019.1 4-hydroxythreonine-4-phosphate dehydrogenase [Marinoscillum furvescens DSM 4134]
MSESSRNTDNKPLIGISIGDINGIGPEVVIKALTDNRILRHLTPVIYADGRVISYYRKELDLKNFNYNQTKTIDKIHHRKVNVLNLNEQHIEVTPGQPNKTGGEYAVLSLKRALEDLKAGHLNALVTAPLSKDLAQTEEFNFPGHTEYLTKEDGASDSLMFMVSEEVRIGVVTGHIPLKDVATKLNKDLVRDKLQLMIKSLKKDFGIKKPRVGVLGLNPHAGENGLLGSEEELIIEPVIKEFKEKGNLVFGPFPADGFFGSPQYRSFDGILAMYHDQGLIPFKSIAFGNGVNFTAGLSFIRTSPDHGTAFPLAGKGQASESSMRQAIYMAADIVRARKEHN